MVPVEPPEVRRAARGPVGGRMPVGAVSRDLAGEPAAPGQQRLPPPGTSLRVEVAPQGREVARRSARRSAPRHRDRRSPPRSGGGGLGVRVLAAAGLAGLAVSTAVYAVAAAEVRWLRRTARGHRVPGFTPPVSILKPLAGLDEGLEDNLASFYRLAYPRYEMVFSFASASDPAYPVARRVADRCPSVPTRFVFDPRDSGGNAKVDRLAAAAERARHRLLMFSDGNVRVHPDFLARAVSHFADSRVGLVSHLFRAAGAVSVASRVETLYLNGCLLPGTAAISGILRMPCVVGKSILVSRTALEVAGGFPALQHYLAEDYLIGREVRRAGYRVVLSADVIDTMELHKTARAVWNRHRRWAMMRHRCDGGFLRRPGRALGPLARTGAGDRARYADRAAGGLAGPLRSLKSRNGLQAAPREAVEEILLRVVRRLARSGVPADVGAVGQQVPRPRVVRSQLLEDLLADLLLRLLVEDRDHELDAREE